MSITFLEGWQVSPVSMRQPGGASVLRWSVELINHTTGEAWRVLPPFNSKSGAMTIARMLNKGEKHSLTIVLING